MLLALILATNLTGPATPRPTDAPAPSRPTLAELVAKLRAIAGDAARAKAIHDAVAEALDYRAADGAPQDPRVVLERGTANCDGYARLFEALARATGLEAKVVTGVARDLHDRARPHAWNVVRLEGQWRFVDVTFDDPTVEGERGGPVVRDDYFLTAPDVAALDHLPHDARWLLGAPRLSREQFLAQGPERATTRGRGLSVSASRTSDAVVVRLENRAGLHVLLHADGVACAPVSDAAALELRCPATTRRLQLFSHSAATGLFLSVTEWDP